MSTEIENVNSDSAPRLYTADELYVREDDGNRCELVNGAIIMMSPAGSEHGWIANRISTRLSVHVEEHNLGRSYAAETGFVISQNPDTVRAPDACFVSHDRLASAQPSKGYLALAPDLVVEVVSPSDRFSDVESKAELWLSSGSQIVIVADPKTQTIRVYKNKSEIRIYHNGEQVDTGDVCKNWTISVDDIFEIGQ